MLVGTALITLAFVAGLLVWRAVRGEGSTADRDPPTWSEIALVDRATGVVTRVDADGEVRSTSEPLGRTGSVYAADGIVSIANSRTLTVTSRDGGEPTLVVTLPDRSAVSRIPTQARTLLVVGTPTGGNILLVDPTEASVVDVGDVAGPLLPSAPLMFVDTLRANASGTVAAIADAANFQTIVIRADEAEPTLLPNQPVAAGDDLVATSQTVGRQADIALRAFDRTIEATAPMEIPAGATFDGDRMVAVSIDGGVFHIEPGDDEAERIGSLALPADATLRAAHPAADGTRIVASGPMSQAVVDLDGVTIYSTVFAAPVEVGAPEPTWHCLPIGGTGQYHAIIDLATGLSLADLTGLEVMSVVDDGCTVLGRRNGLLEVVSADGVVSVGDHPAAVLSPDGRAVVTTSGDGVVQLVRLDGLELGESIDLTALAGTNSIIVFVPD